MTCHLDVSNRPDKLSRVEREVVAEAILRDDAWKGEHLIAAARPELSTIRSHASKCRKAGKGAKRGPKSGLTLNSGRVKVADEVRDMEYDILGEYK